MHEKIQHFLAHLTEHPGVYQMYNAAGEVIYVGKARNLKKRVSSYFQQRQQVRRIAHLVAQIDKIEVIVTSSEQDALILESNLIKSLRPRFNVLLRDDKSYPYLYVDTESDYPRIDFYRGARQTKGHYFGPYPSASAVHVSLNFLQKVFRIRQCSDHVFRHRSRPCMQYQIQRCSAPCVGYISQAAYQQDVANAMLLLEGKSELLMQSLVTRMTQAADAQHYEQAAMLRDQIKSLQKVQQQQVINRGHGDVDVLAIKQQQHMVVINSLLIRRGYMLGSKNYFLPLPLPMSLSEVLQAFIAQFYINSAHSHDLPNHIYVNHAIDNNKSLAQALSHSGGKVVSISYQTKGKAAHWLKMAGTNAELALQQRLQDQQLHAARFSELQQALQVSENIERIVCFDISHTQGEATVAAVVVFEVNGACKRDYRRFNIRGIQGGDDYAALTQAMLRYFQCLKDENKKLPDLLMIDGGRGQLNKAHYVLSELQIQNMLLLAIAKGPARKPGLETLWLGNPPQRLKLAADAKALHLLQEIRDEAHRFAITGHRKQRAHARKVSILENIPGIGANRRKNLLHHFGGLQAIKGASIEELAKVVGISRALAQKIYDYLR